MVRMRSGVRVLKSEPKTTQKRSGDISAPSEPLTLTVHEFGYIGNNLFKLTEYPFDSGAKYIVYEYFNERFVLNETHAYFIQY